MSDETGETDAMAIVAETLHTVLGVDPARITRAMQASDVPGWDSLAMVSIILGVQQRVGVVFSNRDIDSLGCVGDFVDLVERTRHKG